MDVDDVAADAAASADLVFEIAEELDDEGADETGQTEPAAYEDSPPSRLQQAPQRKPDSSRPSSKDAAERKKREEISYEAWQRENENSGSNKDDKGQERRSSRHPEVSRHQGSSRLSERSRHRESSRPRGAAHREEASRHHESPRRRDTARRREASPADHRHRSARSSPEARLVTVVPKFMEAPTRHADRYSRPFDGLSHRARSPAPRVLSHRPRSPAASRQAPVAYERGHSPPRRAHTAWPELFDAQAEPLLTRPHPAGRAPLVHPDPAWEAAQYDHEPYRSHPPATSLDYRHRDGDRYADYAEHDREHSSYREPVYRDSGYADAGYTAASDRGLEYRPSSYDYGRDPYREYPVARPVEVGHDPYSRHEANWEAPRHPEADRHYAYKDMQLSSDSRWGEARYEREANRADRPIPHASASFTRSGSRPEPAHSSDDAHRPFRDNAPRLARDLAPRSKPYRNGQEARLDRDGRPLAPRYAEEYSTGRPHSRDPYERGMQLLPPPQAFRHVSPPGRNPRREEDGSDRHRGREPERSGHHGAHRPRDRSRPHADRGDSRGRTAVNSLELTSRSFAMEAAARGAGHQDADPQQLPSSELPPPPSRPTSAVQASTEGPRPSRASVVVRADREPASHKRQEPSRDSSPELNVEQGFLQAPAGPSDPQDRPFQRGHTHQQAEDTAETANGKVSQPPSKELSGRKARETDHRGIKRVADEPESRHAPHRVRDSSPGRHKVSGDTRKEADSSQRADARRTVADVAPKKESDKGESHRQADRSNSKTEAGRPSAKDLLAAAVGQSKDKTHQSGGRAESKAGAEQARASPAVKSAPQASKDSKATQRRPDPKVVARSPAKGLSGKAGEKTSSRREVVVPKQAGQKRHSRSPLRSRSPKRRASLPDKRTSGNAAEAKESDAKTHDLPPPPARPGKVVSEDKLPPPPARLETKKAEASKGKEGNQLAGALPNSPELPPPPPKPLSKDKPDGTGGEGAGQSKDTFKSARQHDKDKSQKHPQSLEGKAATKPDRRLGNSSREKKQDDKTAAAAAAAVGDGHRTADKSSGGRSGQKRSRSRSPGKPGTANGITAKPTQPKPSDAKRVKSPPESAKKCDAKASSVPNGKPVDAIKDLDRDLKKEWIYADKSKEYGPCTLVRLQLLKKQLQEDTDRNKVAEFMVCDIWRVGDRKNKRRVKDVL